MRAPTLATLLALLGGCESSQPLGSRPQFRVPGCEAVDHEACDVRQATCQTRLLAVAACLRGEAPGPMPPVTLLTEAEYAAYLAAQQSGVSPSPEAMQAQHAYEQAFVLLGLVQPMAFSPATTASEAVAFIWGQYRSQSKDILIIDHGDVFDAESASPVLVHELVHLLQDRQIDLAAFQHAHFGSDEAVLSADALIEGEARMHETQYGATVLGIDPAKVDWVRRFQRVLELDEQELLAAPSPYTRRRYTFPYEWGARYLNHIREAGGREAVRARLTMPPSDTRALMASVEGAVDEVAAAIDVPAPAAPPGWTLIGSNSLGAFGMFLFLAKSTNSITGSGDLALTWRADRLRVYTSASLATTVSWRIELDDPSSARTVAGVALTALGSQSVAVKDATVLIAMTDGATDVAWALGDATP